MAKSIAFPLPKVNELIRRLLAHHMVVDEEDMEHRLEQGAERGLYLVRGHGELAARCCESVVTLERDPDGLEPTARQLTIR